MSIRNASFAVLALAAAACQPSHSGKAGQDQQQLKPTDPVAKIGTQVITAGELEKAVGPQLKQMEAQYREQVYAARKQGLERLLQQRLFEAKAKEVGVASPDQLVEKEILAKIPDPSDDEVKALYDRAKAGGQQLPPIEQVKPDIIKFMKGQRAQGELVAYYDKLKKDMKVEELLPAFVPPKVDVEAKGPTKGPQNAPITIVEFSDYQCPFCIRAEPTVSDLLAAYPGKIRLVFRDFPLPMHPLAPKAAEASQCAQDQGKFWEMHDRLFKVEGKLEVANLKQYARDVGLDGGKFDTCLDSGEKAKVVTEHHKAGEDAGVSGTPAFFINGRLISGAQPLEEFKKLVDQELATVAKK